MSVQTLRAILVEYDLHRRGGEVAGEILRAIGLNELNELVRWAQTPDKMQIAALTPAVFAAAAGGHEQVQDILRSRGNLMVDLRVTQAARSRRAHAGATGGLRFMRAARERLARHRWNVRPLAESDAAD